MENQKNKRKLAGLLIMPRLQLKFSLMIGLTALIVSFLNSFILYYFLKENYELLIELSPMAEDVKVLLVRELKHLWIYMAITTLTFIALSFAWGVYHSHKLAGPIYRILMVLKEINNGTRRGKVTLRPGDEFEDLANEINVLLEKGHHTH